MKGIDKNIEFYSLVNYLFDKDLSYGAKCVLTILLCHEAIQVWDLYEIFEFDTEENITSYFQELLNKKYVYKNHKNNCYVPFDHPYDELLGI